ncbi:aminotransferase class I/II-fold pyridoxal phosphate-dependent enzyme [Chitinispirillales bacterium ANBcel5]|uniref:pyridoxal phosphate-dependent aminotransferase n=1 Tax=Cellulosispirillum alkaliphilum TaxID=3039283 RepID=UPI002A515309|nr:aminotransferase class I/II-fold pyridoxal phosphate-dependent enzyme [Chitinispirillales bacterium ANBcel5]
MIPALNPLVLSLKESATLAVNIEACKMRKQGTEVYHFGFGESPFPVSEPIQSALRENCHQNHYLPTRGLPELCEAVATFYKNEYGHKFTASDVFIGPGSKELIFQTIYLMEGPLLVPAPSWVSYGPQAALRGKTIVPIETKRDNNYKITPEELDKACYRLGQSQKLLILNNPNNPTGCVYTDEEMAELAAICRAYHIVVISDEIYAMIDFTQKKQSSMHHYYPEGTIVSGGLSKSFSAGGYRLGVLLVPEELGLLKQALKSIISETYSSVSAPIQYAALKAYSEFESIRSHIKTCSEIHCCASTYLHKRCIQMNLNCPKPDGAFYLFPDFENYRTKLKRSGIVTGPQLSRHLLENIHVAILPASDFYLPATHLGVRMASVDYDGAAVLRNWPGADNFSDQHIDKFFPNLKKGADVLQQFLESL